MAKSFNDTVVDFGEEDGGKKLFRHPLVVVAHLLFRVTSLGLYIFATYVSRSFIVCFLTVLFLLTLDFWTVKNISGRLLVGLRWWNFVDSEGVSHWKFESRKDQSRINEKESRIFWSALILTPLFWLLLAFVALFTFKMNWLVVTILGICMTGSNLYGYLRCKWSSRQEFTSYISSSLLFSFLKGASKQAAQQQAGGSG